ncbi:MAG TPA: class IV adenylate cyclase [Thermoplasmata archaeon]|nr:class IV adenylate cyclase [Thermoplasmata archaeon]
MARKRRRSSRRDPNRPDVRALDDARKSLERHHESFDDAKQTLEGEIEQARDTLRGYKAPLSNAVEDRRDRLEREMKSVRHFDAPLKAAKKQIKRVHGTQRPAEPSATLADVGAKRLVELKARYEDLGKARALLRGAQVVGTFRQTDTYFSLGAKRLKLRQIDGRAEGQLVYYERPDVGGVKESRVLLAPLPDAATVRDILLRAFPAMAEVRKTREIYRFQGVQIHLDVVERLGKFIEFEKVLDDESERADGLAQLEGLRRYFQIADEDLMTSSYSDFFEPA